MSPERAALLVDESRALLSGRPDIAALLGLRAGDCRDFATLAGALLGRICANAAIGEAVRAVYGENPSLAAVSAHDIAETARRNFEPGGAAATLLFARGAQAVMGHRVAHQIWAGGDRLRALAVKSALSRALGTDIHPGARIGGGLWLDHGLGCVIGETAEIGENVSIWHNVTLGSTLTARGPARHPRIGAGVVIGAGATILGNIGIGAGANIAAGAVVLSDVPEAMIVAGPRGEIRGPARVSFVPPLPPATP